MTLIAGNTVSQLAREARGILFGLPAKELEAFAPDLVAAEGKIHLIGLPENL